MRKPIAFSDFERCDPEFYKRLQKTLLDVPIDALGLGYIIVIHALDFIYCNTLQPRQSTFAYTCNAPHTENTLRRSTLAHRLRLTFSVDDVLPNGTAVTVPLVTNGASVEVTDKNKAEYANKLAQYRLQGAVQREVRKLPLFPTHTTQSMTKRLAVRRKQCDNRSHGAPQIDLIGRGLFRLIPANLFSFFNETEMELILCGQSVVNVDEWQAHTRYVHACPIAVLKHARLHCTCDST